MAVADDGLTVWNLTSGAGLEPNIEPHLKPDRQASEILLSGITSDVSHLYLLTENYASDIALSGGAVYISVDHNLFDERPPLRVYTLD